jgi:hypothetical protein
MSTNAELNTDNSKKLLLRTDKKIIAIMQLVIFTISLIFIVYYRLSRTELIFEPNMAYMLKLLFSSLVAGPLATFLGTVLLIKALQFLYIENSVQIGYKKLRTILFAISVITIILFVGCVVYAFVYFGMNNESMGQIRVLSLENAFAIIFKSNILQLMSDSHVFLGSITGIFFMSKSA